MRKVVSHETEKPWLIKFIEDRYGRKPPTEPVCASSGLERYKAKDGCSVVIIGGGIAGPAFARRMLHMAVEMGMRIKVTLISRPSCNYCGGLITNLSLQTMRGLYGYEPAPEVVLSEIDEVVMVNSDGAVGVMFESPLASVFRTSRFGQIGLDDNFRENILADIPDAAAGMFSVVEPAVARSVELPTKTSPGLVTYHHVGGVHELEADLIVVATGLRSLQARFLSGFIDVTDYRPPPVMPACVTEVELPAGGGAAINRRMLILNGIIKGSVIALIPKQENWITVAALNKVLTEDDLRRVFDHPAVREYVRVDESGLHLPCNKICTSAVFTGPARNFYGDGWVVIGDLTGYGRVLKDGYFAALLGADLAAHTAVLHGCSREAFQQHYYLGIKQFEADNRVGMGLFALNNRLARLGVFNRAITEALARESKHQQYGGLVHAASRALSTGELSYTCIALLFASGLISWAVKNPLRALTI